MGESFNLSKTYRALKTEEMAKRSVRFLDLNITMTENGYDVAYWSGQDTALRGGVGCSILMTPFISSETVS